MTTRTARADELVGQTDLAERLGVRPNTVAIWRRRHPSFPAPFVVLAAGPVWRFRDVERWMNRRNPSP